MKIKIAKQKEKRGKKTTEKEARWCRKSRGQRWTTSTFSSFSPRFSRTFSIWNKDHPGHDIISWYSPYRSFPVNRIVSPLLAGCCSCSTSLIPRWWPGTENGPKEKAIKRCSQIWRDSFRQCETIIRNRAIEGAASGSGACRTMDLRSYQGERPHNRRSNLKFSRYFSRCV